jgi:hypothetical protein
VDGRQVTATSTFESFDPYTGKPWALIPSRITVYYGDFAAFLDQDIDVTGAYKMLRQAETTGRPVGDNKWIEKLENLTDRQLKPKLAHTKRI